MNESSLTEVHRRRLLTQVNPSIPTNVTPKNSTPDQKRPSPNGAPLSPDLLPEEISLSRCADELTSHPGVLSADRTHHDFTAGAQTCSLDHPYFRASPSLAEYKPLNSHEKFRIATLDSFDRGTVALGVLFAAEAQIT